MQTLCKAITPIVLLLCVDAWIIIQAGIVPVQQSAHVAGLVLDGSTQKPLSGVRIGYQQGVGRTISNEEGRFTLEIPILPSCANSGRVANTDCRVGPMKIYASKAAYTDLKPDGSTIPQDYGLPIAVEFGVRLDGLIIQLYPAPSVTGRVMDSYGDPVEGARIIPFRYVYNDAGILSRRDYYRVAPIQSDSRGVFRFVGVNSLDPGDYSFEIVREDTFQGIASIRSTFYPNALDSRGSVVVQIPPQTDIQLGTVLFTDGSIRLLQLDLMNETGETLQGRLIEFALMRRQELAPLRQQILVYKGDRIPIAYLAPGSYELAVTARLDSGLARGHAQIDIGTTDAIVRIPVRKDPGAATLSGRAFIGSSSQFVRAVDGLQLRLSPTSARFDPTALAWTPTSLIWVSQVDGTFVPTQATAGEYRVTILNVPLGTFVASIRTDRGQDVLTDGLLLEGGSQTNFETVLIESPTMLRGTIEGAGSRKSSIAVIPQGQLNTVFVTTTGTSGTFQLGLRPGLYSVLSWNEMEGAPYFDSRFLERVGDRAVQVRIVSDQDTIVKLNVQD